MRRLSIALWLVSTFLFSVVGLSAAETAPAIGLVYAQNHLDRVASGQQDRLIPYREAVEAHGGRIVVIAQGVDESTLAEILAPLDGILLPGGIDVTPKYYGEAPDPKLEKTDADLDELEFRILTHARAHRQPVLAICRGHQLLNVFYGGSLIQDIPTLHTSAVTVAHRGGSFRHDISIAPGSLLHDLLGVTRIEVNTHHHQAVKTLAPGFTASAHSADGIIEAIEGPGEVFILGVQFHPERMRAEEPLLDAIFARFVSEARQTRLLEGELEMDVFVDKNTLLDGTVEAGLK